MDVKELDLKIKEARYIHPIHKNSIFLAKFVARQRFKNILELGTGNGVIALYLAKIGSKITATDVNKNIIETAKKNAQLNNVNVHWIVSDLYKNIDGKYDCIIFIPPYFTFNSFSKFAFILEKVFPTPFEVWIDFLLDHIFLGRKFSTSRRRLIQKFLEQSHTHLTTNGSIFLMVFKSDISFLRRFSYIIYERIPTPFFAAIEIFKIKYKN